MSEKASSTQKDAEAHLNILLDIVRDALHAGEEVKIMGFKATAPSKAGKK